MNFVRSTKLLGALLLFCGILVACGGGGGSNPSAPSGPISFASTEVAADCTGANCASSTGAGNTYSGTGTGVWRYINNTSVVATGDINIQNVPAGKTVTLLFANGNESLVAPTTPVTGVLAAPTPAAAAVESLKQVQKPEHEHHNRILDANRKIATQMLSGALKRTSVAPTPVQAETITPPPRPVVVGDTKVWNENGFDNVNYSTTAKQVCPAGTFGRKVVIWVQTSAYPNVVTNTKLAAYQSAFCGTNNDGAYAKIASLLGDAWGAVPSKYVNALIADSATQKQDINIVIVAPTNTAGGWGGYFYSLNNLLKTASPSYANSNEALVFFVNAYQSQNYTNSVLIHELTHMINYYQRTVLHDDSYESWLDETSAMMTQDLFDPGLPISAGCTPIICELRDYARTGAGVNYFNWPTTTISSAHYNLGGAFGAFLNRRFGPSIYVQLMTDCYTPTTNTSGFACLDFLIKQNGGEGFKEEFAKFGASVFGRMGGTGEPAKYGFPAKSGTLAPIGNLKTSYSYSLPAFDSWWLYPSTIAIPQATTLASYTSTTHTYQIDTVASGKTSYVRTSVAVPAKTTLITVIK